MSRESTRRSTRQPSGQSSATDLSAAEDAPTLSTRNTRSSRAPSNRSSRGTTFSRTVNLDVEVDVVPAQGQRGQHRMRMSNQPAPIISESEGETMSEGDDEERTEQTPSVRSRSTPRRRNDGGDADSTPRAANAGRALTRPSLGGSSLARGMTVDKRAEIVRVIARDCLNKLLSGGDTNEESASRKAWAVLHVARTNYLFNIGAPPFADLARFAAEVPSGSGYHVGRISDTIDLSNLCTFLWTILAPDHAASQFPGLDADGDAGPSDGESSSAVLRRQVARRNALLLAAWKKFWFLVVSREDRANEKAMRLWLDFATMIVRTWQLPTISPSSLINPSLPAIPDSILRDLFSPSALFTYGQWPPSASQAAEDEDADPPTEESIVKNLWKDFARRRQKTLNEKRPEILDEQFRWGPFSGDMHQFVQVHIMQEERAHEGAPSERAETPRAGPASGRRMKMKRTGHPADTSQGQNGAEEDELESEEDQLMFQSEDEEEEADAQLKEEEDEVHLADLAGLAQEMQNDDEEEGRASRMASAVSPNKARSVTATPRAAALGRRGVEAESSGVDFALAAEIAEEMEREAAVASSSRRTTNGQGADVDVSDMMPSMQDIGGRRRRDPPQRELDPEEAVDQSQWALNDMMPNTQDIQGRAVRRDDITPGPSRSIFNLNGRRNESHPADGKPKFNFAAPQPGAKQIPWDSQPSQPSPSPQKRPAARGTSRNGGDEDRTPRPQPRGIPSSRAPAAGRGRTAPSSSPPRTSRRDAQDLGATPGGFATSQAGGSDEELEDEEEEEAQEREEEEEEREESTSPSRRRKLDKGKGRETALTPMDVEPAQTREDRSLTEYSVESPPRHTAKDKGKGRDTAPTPSADFDRIRSYPHGEHNDVGQDQEWQNYDPDDYVQQDQDQDRDQFLDQDQNPDLDQYDDQYDDQLDEQERRPAYQRQGRGGGHGDDGEEDELDSRNASPQPKQESMGRKRRHSEVEDDSDSEEIEEIEEAEHARSALRKQQAQAGPSTHRIQLKPTTKRRNGRAAQPPAKRARPSARAQPRQNGSDFASPTHSEDEEDQALLRDRRQGQRQREDQRSSSRREPQFRTGEAGPSNHNRRSSSSSTAPSAAGSGRKRKIRAHESSDSLDSRGRSRSGSHDSFMYDSDGERLRPDPNYVVVGAYDRGLSNIHGQRHLGGYTFARLDGVRYWTHEQQLLFYRTVQKVPMTEEYPFRVVWQLHGEDGRIDNRLEDYNTQHMKDKMKTILDARRNQGRLIELRARRYLPWDDERRIKFEEEMDAVKGKRRRQQARKNAARTKRNAEANAKAKEKRKAAADARKRVKEAEKAEEEEIDTGDESYEEPQSKRKQAKRKQPKRAKKKTKKQEQPSEDGAEEDDAEKQGSVAPPSSVAPSQNGDADHQDGQAERDELDNPDGDVDDNPDDRSNKAPSEVVEDDNPPPGPRRDRYGLSITAEVEPNADRDALEKAGEDVDEGMPPGGDEADQQDGQGDDERRSRSPSAPAEPVEAPKRKRGRPRKNPVPEVIVPAPARTTRSGSKRAASLAVDNEPSGSSRTLRSRSKPATQQKPADDVEENEEVEDGDEADQSKVTAAEGEGDEDIVEPPAGQPSRSLETRVPHKMKRSKPSSQPDVDVGGELDPEDDDDEDEEEEGEGGGDKGSGDEDEEEEEAENAEAAPDAQPDMDEEDEETAEAAAERVAAEEAEMVRMAELKQRAKMG